jgi:hypothetical protein
MMVDPLSKRTFLESPDMAKNLIVVLVVAAVTFCGCRSASPLPRNTTTPLQYSAGAFDSGCFVKLYQKDGSYYMTQQSQKVDAVMGLMQVRGTEPGGTYLWQMSPAAFTALEGQPDNMKWLPAAVSGQDYCVLVLACFQTVAAIQPSEMTSERILGNWAYPVKSEGDLRWYQSKSSAVTADIVAMMKPDGTRLAARGYGYHSRGEQLVPSKVEIYRTNAASTSDQRLLEIDYFE